MPSTRRQARVAIIGSGFSGLCLAIQLKQRGIEDFTILEKADRLGGTWRENTYPGCCCDVPAFAYCYSFEQKTDWSRLWAPQSEILEYLDHCAEKYGILPHVRFGAEVVGAVFDSYVGVWTVRLGDGTTLEAEVLVSGVGQLHKPYLPNLPGLDRFEGPWFHSARWRHDVPLDGKRVAVVGNAASAIQFVPQIADAALRVHVFQRSANWMVERGDRPTTPAERKLLARFPLWAKFNRALIWFLLEIRWFAFKRDGIMRSYLRRLAQKNLESSIPDPELRRRLTPDYPVGAKRILVSDDYYPALLRDDVELVTEGIDRFTEDAVVTKDGRSHEIDVVILATGFETTSFLAPMKITGRNGRILENEWADGARAYQGICMSGFPNFFMMYGPNTNLGHNSIIFMIECQTRYILQCIEKLREPDVKSIEVRRDVLDAWDERVQRELAGTAWVAVDHSWYKNAAGRITNNWSGSTTRYWWNTRRVNFADFEIESAAKPERAAPASVTAEVRAA